MATLWRPGDSQPPHYEARAELDGGPGGPLRRAMTSEMTYARYLALDALLDAQQPLSDTHDELLCVILHQTKALGLKQTSAARTRGRG